MLTWIKPVFCEAIPVNTDKTSLPLLNRSVADETYRYSTVSSIMHQDEKRFMHFMNSLIKINKMDRMHFR